MEFDEIYQHLNVAIQKVLDADKHLLVHNINEPAISHRLAVYLESMFPGFNVDCEYNGNVDAKPPRKYINLLMQRARELGLVTADETTQEFVRRCVIPDIIVHKRGCNGSNNNLLVIEIKKSTYSDNGQWDAEKLKSFTSSANDNNFEYDFGVFVKFFTGNEPDFCTNWYRDGRRIQTASEFQREC